MHDAGAANKVQPESWKCVCLMHDACSFWFSDLAGWDSPCSHILCAKSFMDSVVQCELGPWSPIPLVDRVTGQLIHCCTQFKQYCNTKLLKNVKPGPINQVEAYSWQCVCLMHDACSSLFLNQVQQTKCNRALGNMFALSVRCPET